MTTPFPDNIFRAYDIRGIVGQGGLDREIMVQIGKAVASEALDQVESTLMVGEDARLSSPDFSEALIEGIRKTGCDVIHLGTIPTPLLYFATHVLETTSGVMITGSHNPKDYNGVKIVLKNQCLAVDQITRLKDRIKSEDFHTGKGSLFLHNIMPDYIKRICADIHYHFPGKVVIDCGNGVAGHCAPMLFAALGCQVIPLHCQPDGNFPNHHPDPTRPENLADLVTAVREEGAMLGIAFDGDGDRVGLVSHSGRIIDADRMLLAFINDILPTNPGASIVFDVKTSQQVAKQVNELGGVPVMCKSGHSFVKQQMHHSNGLLGGEFSAHIFFQHRWYGFDDGMYTAARFLELMDSNRQDADRLLEAWPDTCSTPEIFIPVSDNEKFPVMATLQERLDIPGARMNRLDGLRVETDKGWGLVRASNTTPNLVLRFEAESPDALDELQQQFRHGISSLAPSLDLTF